MSENFFLFCNFGCFLVGTRPRECQKRIPREKLCRVRKFSAQTAVWEAISWPKCVLRQYSDTTGAPEATALAEQHLGMADPSGSGIFKDLARAQARVKIDEVTRIMAEMEATCSNLAATVVSLGEGLNEQSDLDAAVAEIRSTENQYVSKARVALVHLAKAAGGGPPAVPPPPPPALPRPEVNRFMKISATAEPTNLPRDVTPALAYEVQHILHCQPDPWTLNLRRETPST